MLPRPLAAAIVLSAAAVLASCAVPHSLSDPAPSGVPTPASTESFGEPGDQEQLVVRYDDTELQVATMDAALNLLPVPPDLPSVVADELYVFVRPAGWTLTTMQFTGDPYECGERAIEPEQRSLGGGWWAIRPIGPAGEYTLHVSAASGPGLPFGGEIGAASAYIALETTDDRTLPPPGVTLDVGAYEGEAGSVQFSITGLAESPREASATVTLTAEDGSQLPLKLAATADCNLAGDVTLAADLSVDESGALASGGFDYEIELVLDGTSYEASGSSGPAGGLVNPTFEPALE